MASSASQAGLFPQEGYGVASNGYTTSSEAIGVQQGVVPSSKSNQESRVPGFGNLPSAPSNIHSMELPVDTLNAGSLNTGAAPWPDPYSMEQFPRLPTDNIMMNHPWLDLYSMEQFPRLPTDNIMMSHPSLGRTDIWTGTPAANIPPAATPYVNSGTALTGIYALPMPPSIPPVAHGSLVPDNPGSLENPADREPRDTRRTEEDWQNHRSTIKKLYMDQNMALPSVVKVMKEKHGFCATQKRYKEKFKIWRWEKNLTRKQSKFITRKALRRLNEEGKKTEFRIRKDVVPQEKVDRHLKNIGACDSTSASTPSGLSYRTVHPDSQLVVSREQSTPPSQQLIRSPRYHRPLSSVRLERQRSHSLNPTNPLALDWQGHTLDELRDRHTRAVNLAQSGDHEGARIMFWDAMDGLESLVGPTHHSTVETMWSFVQFCLSNSFYDEAMDRIQKSLADHQATFGESHQQTLDSMVRLGEFYITREQYGSAEIILVRAKNGLESLFRADAEELLRHTHDVGKLLAELYEKQGDYDRSEQEYLSMISRAETLQGPYRRLILHLKHDLAHLYMDNWIRHRSTPFFKVEQLLLECIELSEAILTLDGISLCVFELLRDYYHCMDEDLKLKSLLIRIDNKIGRPRVGFDDVAREVLLRLESGLARSYGKLGKHTLAEWWYLRLQPEVEDCFGPDSREAIENIMQTGISYLCQGEWDEAERLFRDAQRRADVVLEPDDPVKERIAQYFKTRSYKSLLRAHLNAGLII